MAFLRRVVNSTAFATADLDTALIERERAALFDHAPLPVDCAAAGVVARELAQEAALQDSDPWSRRDGWRLFGGATRHFDLDIGGTHHRVTLHRGHDGALTLACGAQQWPLSCRALGADRHDVRLGEQRWTLAVYAEGERVTVFAPHGSLATAGDRPAGPCRRGRCAEGRLTAPMPGKVVAFLAAVGERVLGGPGAGGDGGDEDGAHHRCAA